jgi:hypothetical protein
MNAGTPSTAVIFGNGPSLDQFNPRWLDHAYTFGTNSIFRKFKEWGRETDAVVIVDGNRLDEIGDAYRTYSGKLYIGHHRYFRPPLNPTRRLVGRDFIPLTQLYWADRRMAGLLTRSRIKNAFNGYLLNQSEMSFDLSRGFVFSASVIIPTIQLAASLGFKRILLTGVDASYTPGSTHAEGIQASKLEPYRLFGFDFRAELEPLLVKLQICFERTGVELVDCTPNGKLRFIQKGCLENFLDAENGRNLPKQGQLAAS